ncbi:hypothetical protein DICPUDRAFT_20225, partial [Dictyostelium purpureum]
ILLFTIYNQINIINSADTNGTSTNSSSSSSEYIVGRFYFQHFLIIIFVVGIMLFLSFSLIQVRIRLKNRMIDRIPRNIMPFLRPGDLSNKQRTIILNEIVRSKQIQSQIEPIMIGDSPTISHLGWGPPNTGYSKVHFKTSIAKSWIVLEKAATHYNPELKRDTKLCIRDYVEFLLEKCPQIEKKFAYHYIDIYECARFSDQEFTLEEYTDFMSNLIELIKTIGGVKDENNNIDASGSTNRNSDKFNSIINDNEYYNFTSNQFNNDIN